MKDEVGLGVVVLAQKKAVWSRTLKRDVGDTVFAGSELLQRKVVFVVLETARQAIERTDRRGYIPARIEFSRNRIIRFGRLGLVMNTGEMRTALERVGALEYAVVAVAKGVPG